MAGNVSGFIGNEQVDLNNAATETTLAALLAAVQSIAGGSAAIKIANLAGSAGINPDTVDKANDNVKKFTTSATDAEKALRAEIDADVALVTSIEKINSAFVNATSKLVAGTFKSQDLYSSLGMLPGPIGIVANAFGILAGYQQQNLEAQQSLAKSGAAFGGALTEVRAAAANSFLTLNEFSTVVSKNQAIISSLGGSMEAGIKKFVSIQNELLAPGSPTQQNLASLGYSAADAADLTASYMRSQGTMNKEALKDNKAVSASIGEYAQQLDMMSQLTGKSRAELQAKMDKENTEAQWQSALASMSKEKADKLQQGMRLAMTQGGQGAVDAFKAMALGLPPMTEEGKLYMATQRAGTNALKQYVSTANDASISSKKAAELNRSTLAKQIADGANDQKALQKVLQADALAGGKLSKSFADSTALQTKFQGMTQEQIAAELEKMSAEEERQKSQAADFDAANKNLQELGQSIIGIINPLVAIVTPAFKLLGGILAGVGKWLNSFGDTTKTVISTIGLLGGALFIYFMRQSTFNKMDALKKITSTAGNTTTGIGSKILSAVTGAGAKESPVSNIAKTVASTGAKASPVTGLAQTVAGKVTGAGAEPPGLGAAKNAANKVGGIGTSLAGIGKGIGDAIKGVLKGLASGLGALGNPKVLLGGVTLGVLAGTLFIASKGLEGFAKVSWEDMGKGFVTLLGLGTLAAVLSFASPFILAGSVAIGALGLAMIPFGVSVALAGPQMQNLAKGLTMLSDVSAFDILKLTGPIAGLGVAMMSLGAGVSMSESGIKAITTLGPAMNTYAQGITAFGKAVNTVDLVKAEKLKAVLKGPTAAEALTNAGAQMIQAVTKVAAGSQSTEEKTATHLESLNSTMQELVKYMKDTAENTEKTHKATKSLNGNLWA